MAPIGEMLMPGEIGGYDDPDGLAKRVMDKPAGVAILPVVLS